MKIIAVKHKTVGKLMKKAVKEYWLEDKDAYLQFTDGSTIRIHVLNPSWKTYVNLETLERGDYPAFVDSTDTHLYYTHNGDEQLFTSRTVSFYFNNVRYYINDKLKHVTQTHTPIIEIHYYEEGEPVASYNS